MLCLHPPRVQLLAATNLDPAYQHAQVINWLRALAALQVVAAHLRAQLYPGLKTLSEPGLAYQVLAFFTGFAHLAVVLFFVLSGWLVGGSLLNRWGQPGALRNYAIDRITRMWIVLIPAFVLTLLLGGWHGDVDLARFDAAPGNPWSAAAFAGNLVGVQDLAVPRYGGNFALWSLSNEMWYYLLFPLLVASVMATQWRQRAAAVLACVLLASQLSDRIVLYFTIWLLGVAFSRIRIDAAPLLRGLAIGVLAIVAVTIRLIGANDILEPESFLQDLLFSLLFLTILASLQYPARPDGPVRRRLARVGEVLAGFSFTLYVIHVPLLLTFRETLAAWLPDGRLSPHQGAHFALYFALLALITGAAWLFHLPFEARTYALRGAIRARLDARRASAPTVA